MTCLSAKMSFNNDEIKQHEAANLCRSYIFHYAEENLYHVYHAGRRGPLGG